MLERAALVLDEPLSLWGGLDARSGLIIDRRHPQAGEPLTDRLVVMPGGRGSSSSASTLAESIRLGTAPAALVMGAVDGILVLGSLVAGDLYGRYCPVVVSDVEVATGDVVRLDGQMVTHTGRRVELVEASATHELRQSVVRPNQPVDDRDEDGAGAHVAVLQNGEIVGVGSLVPHVPQGWRVSCVVVRADTQRQGIGALILRSLLTEARRRSAPNVWCEARLATSAFYEKHGFTPVGAPTDHPQTGPHVVMKRPG